MSAQTSMKQRSVQITPDIGARSRNYTVTPQFSDPAGWLWPSLDPNLNLLAGSFRASVGCRCRGNSWFSLSRPAALNPKTRKVTSKIIKWPLRKTCDAAKNRIGGVCHVTRSPLATVSSPARRLSFSTRVEMFVLSERELWAHSRAARQAVAPSKRGRARVMARNRARLPTHTI